MASCIKTTHLRGANEVLAGEPKRMTSADGTRYAISRMQKRHLANHRWDVVECWTLKQRVNGKAVTVAIQRSEEDAKKFVEDGTK